MDSKQERQKLRKELRLKRRSLSIEEQDLAAHQVCNQLQQLPQITHANHVACYLPNDGEVSLNPFIETYWQPIAKKAHPSLSLPVLHPVCKGHLLFLHYHVKTQMMDNTFGIPEPVLRCPDVIPTRNHQVILMPLVGFDSQGNRLGMGGGFYDRTLASIRDYQVRPLLVGIAHDCQQVASLPIQQWDVPLDAIVTPTRVLQFSS